MDSKQAIDDALIDTFCGITSSTKDQASFFLESHNGDLNAAVSTFFDSDGTAAAAVPRRSPPYSPSDTKSASLSPSRSRSPSPSPQSRAPYTLRSRKQSGSASSSKKTASGRSRGVVHTFSDLNRAEKEASDSDSDEPNEYYTGGEKSGMLVQGPPKGNDVESIFNQAREFGGMRDPADFHRSSSSSRSFSGTGRTLAGDTVSSTPQPPEVVNHTIIFWANGFTVDDGPLRGLDDPENAPFLESIRKSECPKELEPADRRTQVNCELGRREENYIEPVKHQKPFKGVGRTLGSSSNTEQEAPQPAVTVPSFNSAPLPSRGLLVDDTLPLTSIQLRLVDGTRMVSRFNSHHTIRDIRAFIDASRPGGARNYQLQAMGFPPKLLADEDQTIEQAGLASSVVIQKF